MRPALLITLAILLELIIHHPLGVTVLSREYGCTIVQPYD